MDYIVHGSVARSSGAGAGSCTSVGVIGGQGIGQGVEGVPLGQRVIGEHRIRQDPREGAGDPEDISMCCGAASRSGRSGVAVQKCLD